MVFEELQTKRLVLRKLTPEVYRHVFENFEEDEMVKFFGFDSQSELFTEEEKCRKGLSTYNRSFLIFQLIDKASQKVIGWCGLHTWYTTHFRGELGYVMTNEKFRNKGLMTEALAAAIDYGFNQMDLHRIEAFVGEDNAASLKLLERFKFKQEGRLKEHYFTNNRMEDSILYALLKRT